MTKAQLIEQNTALRKENTTLRTQLEAATTGIKRSTLTVKQAIAQLAARFPDRKSFTLAEVTAEAHS